jgi:hypothetical protein
MMFYLECYLSILLEGNLPKPGNQQYPAMKYVGLRGGRVHD